MRNYARIGQEIRDSIWLITESGLTLIVDIFNRRIAGDNLTDEQIAKLLESSDHGEGFDTQGQPYIVDQGMAVFPIYGPIFGKANLMTQLSGATSMEQFRKDFKMAVEDDAVKSILLDVDSPGGTSDMIEEAGEQIYEARGAKPIYALANDQIGSAAYWLASQAQHLYGTPSGEVGSIGAFTVHKDQSKADAEQGIKYTIISAGKYKTEGNPHEPLTSEGREYRQEVINELYDTFVSNVARGRGVETAKIEADFGQGRMVPNKKALLRGMIDGLREYDGLAEQIIASHPTPVSFMMGNKAVTGVISHGHLAITGTNSANISVADYEHSEPGTGSPPAPRVREDEDLAIQSGSRRPDIPDPPLQKQGDPGAPKAMAEASYEQTVVELSKLLGVSDHSEMIAKVTQLKENDDALRADVDRQKNFAMDYPDEYARMMRAEARELEANAKSFVDSMKSFTRSQGDSQVKTDMKLSSLAQEQMKEYYLNVASGKASLAQFESLMNTIVRGGVVNMGEVGSSRTPDTMDFSVGSAQDVKQTRELFASVVKEIQVNDGLDYRTALSVAAQRHPDLAEAYRTTTPA